MGQLSGDTHLQERVVWEEGAGVAIGTHAQDQEVKHWDGVTLEGLGGEQAEGTWSGTDSRGHCGENSDTVSQDPGTPQWAVTYEVFLQKQLCTSLGVCAQVGDLPVSIYWHSLRPLLPRTAVGQS